MSEKTTPLQNLLSHTLYLLCQPVMATKYPTNQIESSHLEFLCGPLMYQSGQLENA